MADWKQVAGVWGESRMQAEERERKSRVDRGLGHKSNTKKQQDLRNIIKLE